MRPIAVFDSGVGGLPYLRAIRELLPERDIVYLADRAGFPYGTKSREQVIALAARAVRELVRAANPSIVVIACNTASTAALDVLRREFPALSFVGTVPAVKPAAERTRTGVIGVMATERTIRDPYLDELLSRYASGVEVRRLAAPELVEFVERKLPGATESERKDAAKNAVKAFEGSGVDEVVLACTHFLHVDREIAEALGVDVATVDSREGVARQTLKLAHAEDAPCGASSADEGTRGGKGSMYVTGFPPFERRYELFAEEFGLSFSGSLYF